MAKLPQQRPVPIEGLSQAIVLASVTASLFLSPPPNAIIAAATLALIGMENLRALPKRVRFAFWLVLALLVPLALSGFLDPLPASASAIPVYVVADRRLRLLATPSDAGRGQDSVTLGAYQVLACLIALITFGYLLSLDVVISSAGLGLVWVVLTLARGWLTLRHTHLEPVPKNRRILAGERFIERGIIKWTGPPGLAVRVSPELATVSLEPLPTFSEHQITVGISYSAERAGPVEVAVSIEAWDSHGLVRRTWSHVVLLFVTVVPRARYAAWLAQRFLATVGDARVPSHRDRPTSARRREEFAALRPYQPGDNAQDINWKKVAKYHTLVVSEYAGAASTSVFLGVNLETGDAMAADRLALDLISVAMTLAEVDADVSLIFYHGATGSSDRYIHISGPDVVRQALDHLKDITWAENCRGSPTIPDVRWLRRVIAHDQLGSLGRLVDFKLNSIDFNGKQQTLYSTSQDLLRRQGDPGVGIILSDGWADREAIALLREKFAVLNCPILVFRPGDVGRPDAPTADAQRALIPVVRALGMTTVRA